VNFSAFAYRAHDPKWAFDPLSGEGASIHGGRFNPKGVPALYLATTLEGAVLEASHGFAYRFEPLTICTYEIAAIEIGDLTDGVLLAVEGINIDDLGSPWMLETSEGNRPRSWSVYDKLAKRWAGISVPSFARCARSEFRNIVLWRWNTGPLDRVSIFDPNNRLPKDQRSWQ
jgi:RES domain-containing protein